MYYNLSIKADFLSFIVVSLKWTLWSQGKIFDLSECLLQYFLSLFLRMSKILVYFVTWYYVPWQKEFTAVVWWVKLLKCTIKIQRIGTAKVLTIIALITIIVLKMEHTVITMQQYVQKMWMEWKQCRPRHSDVILYFILRPLCPNT